MKTVVFCGIDKKYRAFFEVSLLKIPSIYWQNKRLNFNHCCWGSLGYFDILWTDAILLPDTHIIVFRARQIVNIKWWRRRWACVKRFEIQAAIPKYYAINIKIDSNRCGNNWFYGFYDSILFIYINKWRMLNIDYFALQLIIQFLSKWICHKICRLRVMFEIFTTLIRIDQKYCTHHSCAGWNVEQ